MLDHCELGLLMLRPFQAHAFAFAGVDIRTRSVSEGSVCSAFRMPLKSGSARPVSDHRQSPR
jgi:hypothetical protein